MSDETEEEKMNEIFLKIQQLEEKNEELRKKIKDKEKQKKFNNISKKKIERKEKAETITLDNDRKASLRFENELKFLNNNSLQITENLVEKKIEFKSDKQYGAMYILGDFND